MTGWPWLMLGRSWPCVRPLLQHLEPSKNCPVLAGTLFLDRPDSSFEEPSQRLTTLENYVGERCQSELFRFSPPAIEQSPSHPTRVSTCATRPVEPSEAPRLAVEHQRQTTETRPISTATNESLLHAVRDHVFHPL